MQCGFNSYLNFQQIWFLKGCIENPPHMLQANGPFFFFPICSSHGIVNRSCVEASIFLATCDSLNINVIIRLLVVMVTSVLIEMV